MTVNRKELIEFVRENFEPDDIWPEYLVFESEYDADDWLRDRVDVSTLDWETAAHDGGWVNPEWLDQDSYDRIGEKYGLRVLTMAQISNYHDDNHHAEAVLFCEDPLCKAVGYAG